MFKKIVITESGKVARFELWNTDQSLANFLRRTILGEIPNVALYFNLNDHTKKDINILENDTSIHNEFLSHRLSLVPLCFNDYEVNMYQKLDYKFVIDVENSRQVPMDVTTKDIDIYNDVGKKVEDEMRDRIFPSDPITGDHILLAVLPGGDFKSKNKNRLYVEARATEGISRKNACWSCVSQCSYKNKMDEKKAEEAFLKFVKENENKDDFDVEWERKVFYTMEAKKHFHVDDEGEPNAYEFDIHSECGFTVQYIFTKALDILVTKTSRIYKFLSSLDEEVGNISIDMNGMANVTISQETYSMGNILQSYAYNMLVKQGGSQELEYVGFTCPHPLQNSVILRMRAPADHLQLTIDRVKVLLQNVCDSITDDAKSLSEKWNKQKEIKKNKVKPLKI